MNNPAEIGTVIMSYDVHGVLINADYQPAIALGIHQQIVDQLKKVEHFAEQPEIIKHNSDMVFATWFNRMNEIELADREKYEIVSEVVKCERYETGMIRECVIKYMFKSVLTQIVN